MKFIILKFINLPYQLIFIIVLLFVFISSGIQYTIFSFRQKGLARDADSINEIAKSLNKNEMKLDEQSGLVLKNGYTCYRDLREDGIIKVKECEHRAYSSSYDDIGTVIYTNYELTYKTLHGEILDKVYNIKYVKPYKFVLAINHDFRFSTFEKSIRFSDIFLNSLGAFFNNKPAGIIETDFINKLFTVINGGALWFFMLCIVFKINKRFDRIP